MVSRVHEPPGRADRALVCIDFAGHLFLLPSHRAGHVTKLGRLMVELPLPPSLTRALIKAAAVGCECLLLPVAAMLSVENVFIRPGKSGMGDGGGLEIVYPAPSHVLPVHLPVIGTGVKVTAILHLAGSHTNVTDGH